jgi:diguanylate cyclase (GGDEF)-like protein
MLLNDRIAQAISLAHRQHKSIALLFLDLDGFKHINDSLGHAAGDQLLLSVSKRLMNSVRHSDTVSRLGGDEFVILLSEIAHPEDAATSANKILLTLASPHLLGGEELHIGCSIGMSVYPDDGQDADTLIKNADAAMYHAKDSGRNNCQFFKPEMHKKAVVRQSMEGNLHHAVDREEFLLHYQPKVDLDTGEIKGVEALIRWQQNGLGLIPPARFIPIAETCGLIVPIGRWVMRTACKQARAWQDAGLPYLQIAVNVSAMELQDKGFVRGVRNILSETGLPACFLEIEITESVLMKDVKFTAAVLQDVKAIGVQVAIDDFGTGYSSLSYLGTFPIDTLKVDQSFIQKISSNPDDSPIVNAIIGVAKSLKYLVIAEGVETEEQKSYLQAQQCDWAQGFLFSRPLAATQFEQLLGTGNHLVT